jgi:hypothetical protein
VRHVGDIIGFARRRSVATVLAFTVVVASTTVVLTRPAHRSFARSQKTAATAGEESNSAEHVDFEQPLLSGRKLPSVADAAANLPFKPVAPGAVGPPISVWIPAQARQHLLALVYQHPSYGRFMVIEVPNIGTQQDLEGLAAQCTTGCEEHWSLVHLDDGSEAVLFEGSPVIPYETTGVIWVQNGLAMNVLGPAASFSRDAALALANRFKSASTG